MVLEHFEPKKLEFFKALAMIATTRAIVNEIEEDLTVIKHESTQVVLTHCLQTEKDALAQYEKSFKETYEEDLETCIVEFQELLTPRGEKI